MKKSYLLLGAGLLAMTAAFPAAAQDVTDDVTTQPVVKVFADVADTQIRKDNTTDNSTKAVLEMNSGANIYILMGFDYDLPANMKVQKATLHFVTYKKQNNGVNLYAYSNDFSENTTYAKEKQYVDAALQTDAVATFELSGHGTQNIKQVTDESWQSIDKWQNNIDITNYMATVPATTSRVNFIFEKNVKNQICAKEAAEAAANESSTDFPEWVKGLTDKSVLKPYLEIEFVEDADSGVAVLEPIADTCVRVENSNWAKGSDTTMEIKTNEGGATIYGLMQFDMPADVKNGNAEVTSASLRLVSFVVQSDRGMSLYGYNNKVDESSKAWADVSENVNAAITDENKITSFSVNGYKYSMEETGDKRLPADSEYKNASAWTNTIDLTDYVKKNSTGFGILLKKDKDQNNSIKIHTREAKDITTTDKNENEFTYAASDLKPQLTVAYTKKSVGSGIENVNAELENVSAEYYNLQGMRVAEPQKGVVYIVRQGSKAKKVIF